MSSSKKKVSVIIPVHNGGSKFHQCLSSLYECSPCPDEVIVVADGDSDGSWQAAAAFNAKILKTSFPQGPAGARNLGAANAEGDILFFVDADVSLAKDAIRLVIETFEGDGISAAVIGSYDDEPMETNFLSQYKNLFHHYIHQTSNIEASTFWGACGAVRREIFSEIGGFNDVFRHPSIEDIELGYRLKKAGFRIRLLKDLRCKHLKRWELFSLLKTDFLYRAIPWARLILKGGMFLNDLNLKMSSRLSVIILYLSILSLLSSMYISRLLIIVPPLLLLLIIINRDLYLFFREKRGTLFMLRVIPWHWFYLFYSGIAFLIALIKTGLDKWKTPGW